jgi:hypothetical protein
VGGRPSAIGTDRLGQHVVEGWQSAGPARRHRHDTIPPQWPDGGPHLHADYEDGRVLLRWPRRPTTRAVYGYRVFRAHAHPNLSLPLVQHAGAEYRYDMRAGTPV